MRGVRELDPSSAAELDKVLVRGPRREVRRLELYEDYTRKEVHDVFSLDTPFTPQSGTWGLRGVVPVPDRPGDYVFFVTLGQRQGEHAFDEGITDEGVLSWQSQPRQGLDDSWVQAFVAHDELRNSIYLFFRTGRGLAYKYLGKLKYLFHDAEREHPVYFQWQILNWEPPESVLEWTVPTPQESHADSEAEASTDAGGLLETPPPDARKKRDTSTPSFRARKAPDCSTVADLAIMSGTHRAT